MEKSDSRVELQRQLLNSELLTEVNKTADALRATKVGDYDLRHGIDLQFAVLCHALQESASGAIGTSINLHGVYRALNRLQALAAEAR